VSDGNEANGQSAVNGDKVNDDTTAAEIAVAHEPVIQVLKGEPTAEELAALIAVLGAAGGGGAEPAAPEATRWGLPVDKLRYPSFSWQTITLLERTHMRR
jgi:Acyl-CoA carboxylase epsilon subunit